MGNKQLSDDIRKKIIDKYESGQQLVDISNALEIKYETIRSVIRTFQKYNRFESIKTRQPKAKKITSEIENLIKRKIEEDVSVTLKSLKNSIEIEKNVIVSLSSIGKSIKQMNYSFKRVVLVPAAMNSEANIETRFQYVNEYLLLNEDNVVFLDEMGVNCSLRLSYGRSLVGSPARKPVRSLRFKNYSVCARITKSVVLLHKTKNCAYNGTLFCEFLAELIDIMNIKNMKNFTFVIDNAAFHKVQNVRNIIENNGNRLLFTTLQSSIEPD